MKIEVWSDYVCPFCYIGKRRLEEALATFAHRDEVDIVYKSFELDPSAKTDDPRSIHEMLAQKYGVDTETARTMTLQVAAQARMDGLDYDFDRMVVTGTFDAHRLSHYAKANGRDKELTEALLSAYFLEGRHIGRKDVLTEIAVSVGLERTDVEAVLAGDDFTAAVRADEAEARQIGVQGVPFFVFDGTYAVSGAQATSTFSEVLERVHAEHSPLITTTGDGCGEESCDI